MSSQPPAVITLQALRALHVLEENSGMSNISAEVWQWIKEHPREAGERFATFLNAINVYDLSLVCDKAFSPTEFIGQGVTVWKGPVDSNGLEGEEDRDIREDNLTVIDWEQILLEDHLQEKESSVHGEEKLRRAIASGSIQLGGKAFLSLWEDYKANGENSVLEKLRRKGVTRIYFFGLRLRGPGGGRGVLCLCVDDSEWDWDYRWLSRRWGASSPSVSLASN